MADAFESTDMARVTTSATAFLTRGASNDLVVKEIRLSNTSASDVVVRIWIAPNDSGAVRTVADDDQYEVKVTVPADDTVYVPFNDKLDAQNDTVQMKAATTGVVNAAVAYIEET